MLVLRMSSILPTGHTETSSPVSCNQPWPHTLMESASSSQQSHSSVVKEWNTHREEAQKNPHPLELPRSLPFTAVCWVPTPHTEILSPKSTAGVNRYLHSCLSSSGTHWSFVPGKKHNCILTGFMYSIKTPPQRDSSYGIFPGKDKLSPKRRKISKTWCPSSSKKKTAAKILL